MAQIIEKSQWNKFLFCWRRPRTWSKRMWCQMFWFFSSFLSFSCKITDNWKKYISQITFYFAEEGPGRGWKECDVKCFDFFSSFLSFSCKITDNWKKNISVRSLFILLKKAQAVVQKTSRQNVTSTVLIFSSFLSFWWTSWMGKSQST